MQVVSKVPRFRWWWYSCEMTFARRAEPVISYRSLAHTHYYCNTPGLLALPTQQSNLKLHYVCIRAIYLPRWVDHHSVTRLPRGCLKHYQCSSAPLPLPRPMPLATTILTSTSPTPGTPSFPPHRVILASSSPQSDPRPWLLSICPSAGVNDGASNRALFFGSRKTCSRWSCQRAGAVG